MSVRLYTICAISVTVSAVAGLLVGAAIAAGLNQARPLPPTPVSHSTPVVAEPRP